MIFSIFFPCVSPFFLPVFVLLQAVSCLADVQTYVCLPANYSSMDLPITTQPNLIKVGRRLPVRKEGDLLTSAWDWARLPYISHKTRRGSPVDNRPSTIRDLSSQPNQTYCTYGEGLLTSCAGLWAKGPFLSP